MSRTSSLGRSGRGASPTLSRALSDRTPATPTCKRLAEAAKDWHIEEPEPGEPPYQGLAYFDVADADRFFGREALTAELVAYLKDHRFLAVVGASGSGKSSVVRAGVVAALTNGTIQGSERWWVAPIITPDGPSAGDACHRTGTAQRSGRRHSHTSMDDLRNDTRFACIFTCASMAG